MKQPVKIDLTMNSMVFWSAIQEDMEAKKIANWIGNSNAAIMLMKRNALQKMYLPAYKETATCCLN